MLLRMDQFASIEKSRFTTHRLESKKRIKKLRCPHNDTTGPRFIIRIFVSLVAPSSVASCSGLKIWVIPALSQTTRSIRDLQSTWTTLGLHLNKFETTCLCCFLLLTHTDSYLPSARRPRWLLALMGFSDNGTRPSSKLESYSLALYCLHNPFVILLVFHDKYKNLEQIWKVLLFSSYAL